jgi:hypothetical protein
MRTPKDKALAAARKLLAAVDRVAKAAEEMKKVRAALSLEAGRPPLKVVRNQSNEGGDRGQ